MRLMKRFVLVAALFLTAGCGSSSPVAPTTPPVPACQTNNTATVYFQNRSASNLTYDVLWDGSRLTTIAPGKDSQVYTFAANVTHSLRFQFTNTSLLACAASTPILTTCGQANYGCSS
jgi:hypothetical protein